MKPWLHKDSVLLFAPTKFEGVIKCTVLWCCKVGVTGRCQGHISMQIDGLDVFCSILQSPDYCYSADQKDTALF